MGYTNFDCELIERHLKGVTNVCDYGAQCLYLGQPDIRFASEWYERRGIEYVCIDLAGDNGALKLDLSHPINIRRKFDLVVDCGTSEHIVQMETHYIETFENGKVHSVYPKVIKNAQLGYYYAWLNKHNLLKRGGKMINVNPLTGSWPNHGYAYLRKEFYPYLEAISGYKILEMGLTAAMGNTKTGWNLFAVMEKLSSHFPSFTDFKKLPILSS